MLRCGNPDDDLLLQIMAFRVRERQILDLQGKVHPLRQHRQMTGVCAEPGSKYNGLFKDSSFLPRQRYLSKFLAHLVGFSRHGHQFDVVVPDGEQTGVSLTGSRTGLA